MIIESSQEKTIQTANDKNVLTNFEYFFQIHDIFTHTRSMKILMIILFFIKTQQLRSFELLKVKSSLSG